MQRSSFLKRVKEAQAVAEDKPSLELKFSINQYPEIVLPNEIWVVLTT